MSIVRYDPWSMFDQLRREMDRIYEGRTEDTPAATSDWVPAVDIRENPDHFEIVADVPGVDPKAIEVHAENGVLTVKGERDVEKRENREGYKRIERAHGSFFRRFTLPDTADTDKIAARCSNGVLSITIPKHEKVQPRKITVDG